jgi:uncharacterized protein
MCFEDIPYTEIALFMAPILEILFEILDNDKTESLLSMPGTVAFSSFETTTQLTFSALMRVINVVYTNENVLNSVIILIFFLER